MTIHFRGQQNFKNNMKETYTKEEVIALLVEERTRARDIAYAFKKDHEDSIKAMKEVIKKSPDNRDYASHRIRGHEKLADEARQIGNAISGSTALSMDETIEDRIRQKLEN